MTPAAVLGRIAFRRIDGLLGLFADGLRALGDWMAGHRRWISAIQWSIVLIYAVMVSLPAFLPVPKNGASILNDFTLFTQFIFWGVWWPGVILMTLFAGRIWCGVLCPEGALTETVSAFGLNLTVPRWVKWEGWKFVAFLMTTVYGQMISVYEYPKPVLLILGGSTAVAIGIGLVYGRNKRVWCRYLCPVNGVFGLLSRYSMVHYRVDRSAWDSGRSVRSVNCAPLVDIRRMNSSSACHLCGRCSGHRGAVSLAPRMWGSEIATMAEDAASKWEVRLLLYGMLGVAVGAFQWSSSPWFLSAKLWLAEWLVDHNQFWLLQDDIPWWMLTHWPVVNDVFTWLDGGLILAYIGVTAVIIGGWASLWLHVAIRGLPVRSTGYFRGLACCLVPLAGVSLFLGLSALSVTQLKSEGIPFGWLPAARAVFLAAGEIACLWTALRWLRFQAPGLSPSRALWVLGGFAVASLPILLSWIEMFYLW